MSRLIRSSFIVVALVVLAVGFSTALPKRKGISIKVITTPGGMIQAISSPRPSEMLEPPRDAYLREGTVVDPVKKGSDRFYAVVPCEDYIIDSVIVDDTLRQFPVQNPMLGISSYRWPVWEFRNLTASHTFRVKFRHNAEVTIAASATEGGTIVPSGDVVLAQGSQQAFISKPSTGYRLAHVIVDGQTFEPTESYTFTNVSSSHVIQAVFEKSEN